jgi:glycosyltransferase involved in cell wall biosynthesis
VSEHPPLRLLHAMAGAAAGGAEKFVVRLCLALQRRGVEQRALIRGHANWVAQLRAGGIEPVEAPFGKWLDITTPRLFRREIARFRPDIVLTHMSRPSAMCPRGDFVHMARLGGYFDLKYYRRCDHLIGNTPDIRDYFLRHGWPAERAHVVSNFALETPPAPPVDRAAYGTPGDVPLLVALGRLHADKAFDVLLSALVRMPGCHLWIAGEGPLLGDLTRQVAVHGLGDRVRFLGWVADPSALFGAADVCVMPSRWEPLGNVILEAWQHGIPMVAASSQGPGFLIRSEANGLLVPVDDACALAVALLRVLNDRDLAARLVAGGRETYATRFSEAAIVDQYLDLFARVLAGRR